jgi:hypothetical protein
MTTKIIGTVYSTTYDLAAPVTKLSISASGYLAAGLTTAGAFGYTIINYGAIVGTAYGAHIDGTATLTNAGHIASDGTTAGAAVFAGTGGTIANEAGGEIGGYSGILMAGAAGSVTNAGTIVGQTKYGVDLMGGGTVANDAGALIKGVRAVAAAAPLTLANYGTVVGTGVTGIGVYLGAGGEVINAAGGVIRGYSLAVEGYVTAATLVNDGFVYSPHGAIFLTVGGRVTNGSASDTTATVEGQIAVAVGGAAGTVVNFATLNGHLAGTQAGAGVILLGGGVVVNGAGDDTAALIEGSVGVGMEYVAGTVSNFATIGGTTVVCVVGIDLIKGGTVTNGSATDTTARIAGYTAVAAGAAATIRNFATIAGGAGGQVGGGGDSGVYLTAGGVVTNGSNGDNVASISGYDGVFAQYVAATVTNFGSVTGTVAGIVMSGGGKVINGSATVTGALIEGNGFGVEMAGAAGAVSNFGTILGATAGASFGAYLALGSLANGSEGDKTALIQARYGLELGATARANNFGTIRGVAGSAGAGALLKSGARLTNEVGALVVGDIGVECLDAATITNFGTIHGNGGLAVGLATGGRLNAEAGSRFIGTVAAGSGLVDVVGGTATMTALTTAGKVEGAGALALAGGASSLGAGVSLTVAEITISGAATSVEVETVVTDAKIWRQSAGTLRVDAGDHITFTGAGDSFSGTLIGAGAITFGAGSDTISNATLSAGVMKIAAATVTLAGSIDLAGTLITPGLVIAAAGASLIGGGTVDLANAITSVIVGATVTARLTNADTIRGAGQLGDGQLQLTNSAGGVIKGAFSTALVINTGTSAVINAGLIENVATGGLIIDGRIANSGTLGVSKGTLSVGGAVSGAGVVKVGGGVAVFDSTFTQNVTFTAAAGSVLELAKSTGYTGQISGFSKTGASSLDLLDIAFGGGTKVSFSGTTTSGVLTVTDGTHTANIHLTGNYTTSTFTAADDGAGHVLVTDPTTPMTTPAITVQPLVTAMAGFGDGRAAEASPGPAGGGERSPPLLTVRAL